MSTQYHISENRSLSTFILERFDIGFQNVELIENAQVVLLGETHNNQRHQDDIAKVIQYLHCPQDIVLVEAPHDKAVYDFRKLKKIKKDVTVKGWDFGDVRKQDQVEWPSKYFELISLIKTLCLSDLSNPAWMENIRKLINLYPQKKEMDKELFLEETEKDFGDYPINERHHITNLLIYSIVEEWEDFIAFWIADTIAVRNECMVDVIQDSCFPKRMVFVIAGQNHLVKFNSSGTTYSAKEYRDITDRAITILHRSLQDKKYVILIPKNSEQSNFFHEFKIKWRSSNWKQKAKAIAAAALITPIALAALPFIAAGAGIMALNNRTRDAQQPELEDGNLDICALLGRLIELSRSFDCDNPNDLRKAHMLSDKYNQTIPVYARIFREDEYTRTN